VIEHLQKFVDRVWYPPLLAVLAGLDNFVLIVPTDGLLISSSMLTPRRWWINSLCISLGSCAGALILAFLVEMHGLPWILQFYPGIDQTFTWTWTEGFFDQYGLILVFVVAITPLMQQPTVILASLANTNLIELGAVIFVGRTLKFLAMGYIGSHAPGLLKKIWGVRGELADAGVTLTKDAEK
jgi:membrane protein YqaA with SNARE-associated domain